MNGSLFIDSLMKLYVEMAPYLAFGLFVAGILHVLVNRQFILNHFGNHGILSVIKAAVLGVPLPLCSCSVVPTALSLKKHGASNGATISFLISTPQTGVESIAATAGMMGPVFALFRPLVAFLTGIIGGAITNIAVPEQVVHPVDKVNVEKSKRTVLQTIRELFRYGFGELMDDIAPNLVVGILISGLITVFLPESFFTRYVGNTFLEMIIVVIGAVPLYICATASIPIAAALMMKGMSAGAAFVFLMAGPATNAATITVLYSKLGKRMGTIYLAVIVVSSLVFGLVLNGTYELFGIDPMGGMNHNHHSTDHIPLWMTIAATLFTIPLVWSIWKTKLKVPLARLFKKSISKDEIVNSSFIVEGMSCGKCASKVSNAAKLLSGVADASVNFDSKELQVSGVVTETEIIDAVEKLGYRVRKKIDDIDTNKG